MRQRLILTLSLLAILACPLASTAQQIPAALPNNQFLRGVDLTNSLARNMIGVNRSNVVRIDPDAIGATFGGAVTVDGTLTITGTQTFTGNTTVSGTLSVTGASTLTGLVTAGTDIIIPAGAKLRLDGLAAGDTYIEESAANVMRAVAGANEYWSTAAAGFVINEAAADIDFRIESDTNANHFVSDAGLHTGTGAFGMGAAAVSGRFLNISPGAGSTVGVVILSAGLAVNTAVVTSGTALTVTGTVVMTSLTSASTGDYVCFNTLTNELTQGTATCSLSSQRYKSDIQDMDDMGLDTVLKMRPVTFISRIHPEQGRQPGFIAEDAELVDRRLVLYEKGLVNSFRYLEYTSVLTRAIQEQQSHILDLERRLVQLEARQN